MIQCQRCEDRRTLPLLEIVRWAVKHKPLQLLKQAKMRRVEDAGCPLQRMMQVWLGPSIIVERSQHSAAEGRTTTNCMMCSARLLLGLAPLTSDCTAGRACCSPYSSAAVASGLSCALGLH